MSVDSYVDLGKAVLLRTLTDLRGGGRTSGLRCPKWYQGVMYWECLFWLLTTGVEWDDHHEWGYGIEHWLDKNGHPTDLDEVVEGFIKATRGAYWDIVQYLTREGSRAAFGSFILNPKLQLQLHPGPKDVV